MKTTVINSLENFSGTVLIPVFETSIKNLIPIKFGEISRIVIFAILEKLNRIRSRI